MKTRPWSDKTDPPWPAIKPDPINTRRVVLHDDATACLWYGFQDRFGAVEKVSVMRFDGRLEDNLKAGREVLELRRKHDQAAAALRAERDKTNAEAAQARRRKVIDQLRGPDLKIADLQRTLADVLEGKI
jgi:hypothetical protein